MIRILFIAGVAAGVATPAVAQETRASAAAKFSREFVATDTSKDGTLSLAEVQARTVKMRIGASKDPAIAKKLGALWFARADADKNRKVTEPEAQALLAATFARYDADKDGKIGTAERGQARKSLEKGR
ncbi:hypothetical protein [Sphingomonas sp.]|uniref:hypothetical protein n=1 Tax=Sphingomonas sp. TaxID=28214 RepID=UPI002ED795EC